MNKIKIIKIIIAVDVGALFINHLSLLMNNNLHGIIKNMLFLGIFIIFTNKLFKEKYNNIDISINKSLLEAQNRCNLAIEGINGVIWEINFSTKKSYLNGRASEMLGITKKPEDEFTIKDWVTYIYEEDKERVINFFEGDPKELFNKCKDGISIEYRVHKNDGSLLWIFTKAKMIIENDHYILLGANLDISELKEKEFKIKYMNYFDNITGLYNRTYLKNYIDRYIENNNDKSRAALIFIDIDNFKYINDSFGHDYGDELLRIIALNFKEIIDNESDVLCRFGGDEFVIFMKNFTLVSNVEDVCNQLMSIFNNPRKIKDKMIYSSASIGITMFPDDADCYETLLRQADAAMYKAKGNGKNRYQFFNNEISKELDRNYNIEKGLRRALEDNELFVQFQPKVVLEDSKIMGFEALIRWNSKELGFVSPVEFIPVAENTRIIVPIGRFVIEEVFKKCKQLINMGYEDFKIALNLSEIQLRDGDVINDFESISKQYGVSPKYIEVEITESLLMKSLDKNIETLLKLKEFGVSIALDDFGTGYSSLNYLTKLPIDVLKIDRSFVMEINGDGKSQYIVENIIQLSHKLGIKVVAEGVELKEQVDYLKSMLCDFVQGYYYSKPQDFEKIVNLMENRYL